MKLVSQKYSNYGTENYIVVRTSIQVQDLVKPFNLTEKQKEDVFGLYLCKIQPSLLRGMEISNRIFKEVRLIERKEVKQDDHSVHLPAIDSLELDVKEFVNNCHSVLRELSSLFSILYECELDLASKYDAMIKKIKSKFSESHPIYTFIHDNQKWLKDIVGRRNAIVHPGGWSGEVQIFNYDLNKDAGDNLIHPPKWSYDDNNGNFREEYVHLDLPNYLEFVLEFSEYILIKCLEEIGLNVSIPIQVSILEIPSEKRNSKAPVKFKIAYGTMQPMG